MRKEELLLKKTELSKAFPWHFKMTDDELRNFSMGQLLLLSEILSKSEVLREDCACFYTLSADEVLQKSTNNVACFLEDGTVVLSTKDEVLSGPSRQIYASYLEKNSIKKDL